MTKIGGDDKNTRRWQIPDDKKIGKSLPLDLLETEILCHSRAGGNPSEWFSACAEMTKIRGDDKKTRR
jgi:hypothetical protein